MVLAACTVWGAGALYFAAPASPPLRAGLAGCFALIGMAALAALFMQRWRRPARGLSRVLHRAPRLVGDARAVQRARLAADVAILPLVELDGELATVRNIRNFDYRSETDFTRATTTGLSTCASSSRWISSPCTGWGRHRAHDSQLRLRGRRASAVSIETRKEKNESYSALGGFFRQYELFYVVADERDVIRLRTNYRKDPPEDVYLYRLHGPAENGRRLLREYLHKINALGASPSSTTRSPPTAPATSGCTAG